VWSVGVARTGNMIGLSKADLSALPEGDRAERLRSARTRFEAAGAHYVIDTLDGSVAKFAAGMLVG
jgi:phosphonoacetaldehyde hydrolase